MCRLCGGLGERFVYEFRVSGREFRVKVGAQWAAVEMARVGVVLRRAVGLSPDSPPCPTIELSVEDGALWLGGLGGLDGGVLACELGGVGGGEFGHFFLLDVGVEQHADADAEGDEADGGSAEDVALAENGGEGDEEEDQTSSGAEQDDAGETDVGVAAFGVP